VASPTRTRRSVRQAAAKGRCCYSCAALRATAAHLRSVVTLRATPGFARARIVPTLLRVALVPPRLRRSRSLRSAPAAPPRHPDFGQKRPTAAAEAAASIRG